MKNRNLSRYIKKTSLISITNCCIYYSLKQGKNILNQINEE